ncbi:hypothetical protein FRC12_007993 [Ceratobasidium sp. 428]|nr:hypothetical protein FRC09_014256 [Ceratobasidium sp. 395]KAG8764626.1 hypothetical protein FRC12_007993 [Ceratobasidium sp. 428]
MSDPQVKFVSSDEEEFVVEWGVFRMFGMFAPQDDPKECPTGPFPLPQISASILRKVLEYCEHHKHDPQPVDREASVSSNMFTSQPMSEWDKAYITSVDQKTLFDIILAANYLSIKPLLNLGTRQVSELIKGKSPGQIRELFNIVKDLTPEEEAQIQRDRALSEDSG